MSRSHPPLALTLALSLSLFLFLSLAPVGAGEPWPLGEFAFEGEPGENDAHAQSGYTSSGWTVRSATLPKPYSGWVAVGEAYTDPVAVVVAFTGEAGGSYWTEQSPEAYALGEELRARGLTIVQVRHDGAWWRSVQGEDAGIAHLAQVPATVLDWVSRSMAKPAGVPLVAAGNSAGAAQVAYCLSHYGLDHAVQRAVMSAGPPFAALGRSGVAKWPADYALNPSKAKLVDRAHGIWADGPFSNQDASWVPRWEEESVASGGIDFVHPDTELRFIFGENDARIKTIAAVWIEKLRAHPENDLSEVSIPGMGHKTYSHPGGIAAVRSAILGE